MGDLVHIFGECIECHKPLNRLEKEFNYNNLCTECEAAYILKKQKEYELAHPDEHD